MRLLDKLAVVVMYACMMVLFLLVGIFILAGPVIVAASMAR